MTRSRIHDTIARALKYDFYGPGQGASGFAGELLARWLLSHKRYRAEVMDAGYDVSTRATPVGKPHDLRQYTSVKSFLDEPSGETVATFLSGSGLAAQTLGEKLEDELAEAESRFVLERFPPQDDDRFELFEALGDDDELHDARHCWLDELMNRPLSEVVSPHWTYVQEQLIEEAARREAENRFWRERQKHLRTLGEQARNRLAEAGAPLQARYEMAQLEDAEALLKVLESLGSNSEELHAFVVTQLRDRLSKALRERLEHNYPEPTN